MRLKSQENFYTANLQNLQKLKKKNYISSVLQVLRDYKNAQFQ